MVFAGPCAPLLPCSLHRLWHACRFARRHRAKGEIVLFRQRRCGTASKGAVAALIGAISRQIAATHAPPVAGRHGETGWREGFLSTGRLPPSARSFFLLVQPGQTLRQMRLRPVPWSLYLQHARCPCAIRTRYRRTYARPRRPCRLQHVLSPAWGRGN